MDAERTRTDMTLTEETRRREERTYRAKIRLWLAAQWRRAA